MPRVLNVEQLESKFSSLTRARESITSLSAWILRHSEFCSGIVEEWLVGLKKNFSALNMFYVANDVIMQCGKKRVPQYRPAFADVLGLAMALPNVKEISFEVCRIINIWKDRDIYDEDFCQTLIKKLESQADAVQSPEVIEEKELSIITSYKKEALFDKLIKLKNLIENVNEKEEILKYAEEPKRPDIKALESKACKHMLHKVTKYYEALKGCMKLVDEEIATRNQVLKELNDTDLFYSSQQEDVKKVAHAYKIYGKKIKNVAKELSSKREALPSDKDPLDFSDNDISSPKSPNDPAFSPLDDFSNLSGSPSSATMDSIKEHNHLLPNVDKNMPRTASFSKSSRSVLNQNSKIFQILNEGNQISPTKSEKYYGGSQKSETNVKISEKPWDVLFVSSPKKSKNNLEMSAKLEDCPRTFSDLSAVKIEYNSENSSVISQKPENKKVFKNSKHCDAASETIQNNSVKSQTPEKETIFQTTDDKLKISDYSHQIIEDTLIPDSNSKNSHSEISSDSLTLSVSKAVEEDEKMDDTNSEVVDQMLEKTLKKGNMKRKIGLLLNTKGKKVCLSPSREEIFVSSPVDSSIVSLKYGVTETTLKSRTDNQGVESNIRLEDIKTSVENQENLVKSELKQSDQISSLLKASFPFDSNKNVAIEITKSQDISREVSYLDKRIDLFVNDFKIEQVENIKYPEINCKTSTLDERLNLLFDNNKDVETIKSQEIAGEVSSLDQRINLSVDTKVKPMKNIKSSEIKCKVSTLDERLNLLFDSSKTVPVETTKSQKIVGEVSSLDQRIDFLVDTKIKPEKNIKSSELDSKMSTLDERLNLLFDSNKTVPVKTIKSQIGTEVSSLDQEINELADTKTKPVKNSRFSELDSKMSTLDDRLNLLFHVNKIAPGETIKPQEISSEVSSLDQRINLLVGTKSKPLKNIKSPEIACKISTLDERLNLLVDVIKTKPVENIKSLEVVSETSTLDQKINSLVHSNKTEPLESIKFIEPDREKCSVDKIINSLSGSVDSEKVETVECSDSNKEMSSLDRRIDLMSKNINLNFSIVNNFLEKDEVVDMLHSSDTMNVKDDGKTKSCENLSEEQKDNNSSSNMFLNISLSDISTELLKNIQHNIKLQNEAASSDKKSPENEDSFFSSVCSFPDSEYKKAETGFIPGIHEESLAEKEEIKTDAEKSPSGENLESNDSDISDVKNSQLKMEESLKNEPKENVLDLLSDSVGGNIEDCSLPNKDESLKVQANDSASDIVSDEKVCKNNRRNSFSECLKNENNIIGLNLSKKIQKKPNNILETVHCIFKCLTKNKQSECVQERSSQCLKNTPESFNSGLSLKDCLKIYTVLQSKHSNSGLQSNSSKEHYSGLINTNSNTNTTVYGNPNSITDFCTTTNALQGPISSTVNPCNNSCSESYLNLQNKIPLEGNISKDNFEVTDMECDSE